MKESDLFAIWDVNLPKGQSTGMRKLDMDEVIVSLGDGAIKVTTPDGTSSIEELRLGTVHFEPKNTAFEEEGLSDEPIHMVVFQLTGIKFEAWPTVPGIPDQFPRINTQKLFETDRIAVYDQRWIEGDTVVLHGHYHPTATVFLDGGTIRATPAKGAPGAPFPRHRGEVISSTAFNPNSAHVENYVSGSPRAIWIQFKQ